MGLPKHQSGRLRRLRHPPGPNPQEKPQEGIRVQFDGCRYVGGQCARLKGRYSPSSTLLAGESGLGKSTLVNTLFKSRISRQTCTPGPHEVPRTIEVNSVSHGKRTEGVANWNLGMCEVFRRTIDCDATIVTYSSFPPILFSG